MENDAALSRPVLGHVLWGRVRVAEATERREHDTRWFDDVEHDCGVPSNVRLMSSITATNDNSKSHGW
jgi:hypothetical protein